MAPQWYDRLRAWLDNRRPALHSWSTNALLPSCQPGIVFNTRIHFSWVGPRHYLPAPHTLAQLADDVASSASVITQRYSLVHLAEARDDVTRALLLDPPGETEGFPGIRVDLALEADPTALAGARHHEDLRIRAAFTNAESELQLAQWDELRRQVLIVPHRARLWWLAGRSDKLEHLVGMGGTFEELARLLTPADQAPSAPVPAAEVTPLITNFLSGLDADQHRLLLAQLGRVFSSYERSDLADAVRGIDLDVTRGGDAVNGSVRSAP